MCLHLVGVYKGVCVKYIVVLVSIITLYIGIIQYCLALKKRNDDLFEKRYEIYSDLFKIISSRDLETDERYIDYIDEEDLLEKYGDLLNRGKYIFDDALMQDVKKFILQEKDHLTIEALQSRFDEYLNLKNTQYFYFFKLIINSIKRIRMLIAYKPPNF